jgi:hypothetical protein
MIGPVKGRLTAALAAGALLAGAGTAMAAFVTEAGSPYPVGNQPYGVYTGDFNGDGLPDVATVNGSSGDVSVYLRNAGGGFSQEPGSPFAGSSGNGSAAVADFDRNGLTDLVTTGYGDGSLSVLSAQPAGGFTRQQLTIGGSPQAATAGDFDGDGLPDFVVSLYGANQVVVMHNAGGTFTQQGSVPGGGQPSSQTVADFDGDGLLDFAFINTSRSGYSVTVVRQTSSGVFATEETIPLSVLPGGIAAGDFNGDGRPDLAVTRYGDSTLEILLRNATNDGFTEQPGSPYAVSTSPQGVAVADFDRDGRPDLAVAANTGAIDVLHNTGTGFSDAAIPMTGQTDVGIAVGDLDRDGRPDIVTSDTTNNTFSAILNPAPAAPAPTPTPTATTVAPPVAGSTVNVARRSGTVTIKLKGSSKYVPVTSLESIPVGATIDTRKGRVTITAAQGKGKTASADFFDGLFKLTQTKGSKPVTTLTLTEALSCPKSGSKASVAAKKKKTRKLWGDGSGAFSTRGQYSAATVRGTRWLVTDTCDATVTKVAKGVVSVRDLVKKKTVVVRAPHSYTARRRH